VLVIASYLFYCTWNRKMALVLFLATVLCYFAATSLKKFQGHKARFASLMTTISLLIALLVFFKVRVLVTAGSAIIPLGLSYYTFPLIISLLDVYWKKSPAENDFIAFAAYVAFFPQMIAGPIQRAPSFLPQLGNEGEPRVLEGLLRMGLGF